MTTNINNIETISFRDFCDECDRDELILIDMAGVPASYRTDIAIRNTNVQCGAFLCTWCHGTGNELFSPGGRGRVRRLACAYCHGKGRE